MKSVIEVWSVLLLDTESNQAVISNVHCSKPDELDKKLKVTL